MANQNVSTASLLSLVYIVLPEDQTLIMEKNCTMLIVRYIIQIPEKKGFLVLTDTTFHLSYPI
ncbi:MAG TPA: hypothetical protein VN778_01145 [Verrucomicrobiae bacterium]|nr:hypothetical protein [Verrucomicrobiae bacterium]